MENRECGEVADTNLHDGRERRVFKSAMVTNPENINTP